MWKSLIAVDILCACSLPAFASLEGVLDAADCSMIGGWAWDTTQPNTPISVDIYDGTVLVATVQAAGFRPDLLAAGKGNGYHASSSATYGGSLISKVAVPDGTADYEVNATLSLQQTGGYYSLFMRATSDAQAGPSPRGSYYVVELQNPTAGTQCTATLAVYKSINAVVTALGSTTAVCAPVTTVRVTRPVTGYLAVEFSLFLHHALLVRLNI